MDFRVVMAMFFEITLFLTHPVDPFINGLYDYGKFWVILAANARSVQCALIGDALGGIRKIKI